MGKHGDLWVRGGGLKRAGGCLESDWWVEGNRAHADCRNPKAAGAYKMLPYAGVGLGLLFEDGDADAETMCLVTFGGNVASAIGQNRLTVAAET